MPSPRRVRVIFLTVMLIVFSLLYLSSNARTSSRSSFYDSTLSALKAKDHARTQAELEHVVIAKAEAQQKEMDKAAKQKSKDTADVAKQLEDTDTIVTPPPAAKPDQKTIQKAGEAGDAVDDESDALASKEKQKAPPALAKDGGTPARKKGDRWDTGKGDGEKEVTKPKTTEEKQVELEMNSILKRSPIIIFSKTYCPHSRRAKDILMEQYSIIPAPFVVELDIHDFGGALQAKLADMTGRKTVPNVLISGKSIGGGDEVAELHDTGKLAERIRAWGGKRVQEVKLKNS